MTWVANALKLSALYVCLTFLLTVASLDGPTVYYQGLQFQVQLNLPLLDSFIERSLLLLPLATAILMGLLGRMKAVILTISATPIPVVIGTLSSGASKDMENWPIAVAELPGYFATAILIVLVYTTWAVLGGLFLCWIVSALLRTRQSLTAQA
jgi:hypothetical protein